MIYETRLKENIDFAPESEIAEIMQNLRMICTTKKGTVPLDRDFGLSCDWIDKPYNISKNQFMVEVIEQCEKYEPRAVIRSITFDDDDISDVMAGDMNPCIHFTLANETEEEEDL